MDIQTIFVDPVTGQVSLKLSTKILTGMPKLVQTVVTSLLNVPGKDLLDPGLGGGMPSLIGQNFDPDDPTELQSEVVQRIAKTRTEVAASQVGLDLIPEEKLLDLHVVSVDLSPLGDSAQVVIRITNETGRSSDVVI